jgi:hypothetical protein
MLHVNPRGTQRGLLAVFNPLEQPVGKNLRVNVYYTGLKDRVRIRSASGEPVQLAIDRDHHIELPVHVPAQGMSWFILE